MLFNSPFFIFLFLPVVILIFNLIGKSGHNKAAISWLVVASLFFYGWWNPKYLLLICSSLAFNYITGSRVVLNRSRILAVFGVGANIVLLGYYKYANFFVDNINLVAGSNYNLEKIILPLAISFFTFEQISYIVDCYRGDAPKYFFMDYCLFVIFFPQLIAGPIVHHHEILPQFANERVYKFRLPRFTVGVTIFFIGLFKKVVVADTVARYSTPVFDAALASSTPITFFAAWVGALAYTLQLYFDFSGYSDMAIGIARMFGIRLPLNFHSPYKAVNIIDFWRRWHITLSRFLRDYLYIPLGGNRKGSTRRYVNLMVTMLLGGLWHGAGWTFVIWGGLHGLYLVINNVWLALRKRLWGSWTETFLGRGFARLLTFLAVVAAWVFFRAESLDAAIEIFRAMAGINGRVLPPGQLYTILNYLGSLGVFLKAHGWEFRTSGLINDNFALLTVIVLLLWVSFAPNTQQIMFRYKPALDTFSGRMAGYRRTRFLWQWRLAPGWAVAMALLTASAILGLNELSEFLYFQF